MIRNVKWEQLEEIVEGFNGQRPVWDGNLLSKTDAAELAKQGFIDRVHGYSFPTELGRTVYAAFHKPGITEEKP